MALTSRIALHGPDTTDPEDFFGSSLGVIFPDDVTNQHGDAEHSLVYTSPHLPRPLHIALADPHQESDRKLFSHYLWNSSLLLAELVEAGTLGLDYDAGTATAAEEAEAEAEAEGGGKGEESGGAGAAGGRSTTSKGTSSQFDITSLSTLELGAGTALPSLLAALLGAKDVTVTDYPSPTLLSTLHANASANGRAELSPRGTVAPLEVEGHAWGDVGPSSSSPFAARNRGRFDRVLACDCLWMPWQHANLRRSVAWFLGDGPDARAWVVAGFHTGRARMRGFFDGDALADAGLEVESIWERDCDGVERPWSEDRGVEDVSVRKRWLVVGVLRRLAASAGA